MAVTLDRQPAQADPFRENLVHPMHREFLDHWRSMSPPKGLPGRCDLEPIDIPRLLPWMLLLDVAGTGHHRRFRIRLMGTGVAERSGADSTGRWLDEAVTQPQLQALTEHLATAAHKGGPVRYLNHSIIKGREFVAIDTLALLLAGNGVDVDMLMLLSVEPVV